MKILFFVSAAFCIFSGTSLTASAQKYRNNSAKYTDGGTGDKSLKFIDGIEIRAEKVSAEETVAMVPTPQAAVTRKVALAGSADIEGISSLQFKYAQMLDCNVEDLKNPSLYKFIDEWWETRYRYGGTTKKGIDCSAFTGTLMNTVFDIKLPRTARDQYNASIRIEKEDMAEGDLVFFNTRGGVSHVGVYLGDGFFVHASRNNGVIISRLDDAYYSNRFISAGRVMPHETELTKVENLY